MRILNWEMGSGKTTELVRIMLKRGNEDVVLIAPTAAQAGVAYQVAVETLGGVAPLGLSDRFISVGDLHTRKGRKERYVIDEFDGVLRVLLGTDVVAVAGTDEFVRKGQRAHALENGW